MSVTHGSDFRTCMNFDGLGMREGWRNNCREITDFQGQAGTRNVAKVSGSSGLEVLKFRGERGPARFLRLPERRLEPWWKDPMQENPVLASENDQTSEGSFSAGSRPIFATKKSSLSF